MPDVPDETDASWGRRFSGITHAQAALLMADTRDETRARLVTLAHDLTEELYEDWLPGRAAWYASDLADELKASERDRKALAEARDEIKSSQLLLDEARRYVEALVCCPDEDWTPMAREYLKRCGLPEDQEVTDPEQARPASRR